MNNGSPLFSGLCTLIEQIASTSGTDLRKRRFEKYLYDFRSQYGHDFYNGMRLLLPHLDHRKYNVKEMKLAKIYIEALGLGRNSADAQDLLKFRQPGSSSNKYVKATGDFAGVAFNKISDRSTVQKPTQTINDVNALLDELSAPEDKDEKPNAVHIRIFRKIINLYTAFEQKWLIRIILKDLKMGMSDGSIFQVYHPQAREMYSVCSNFEKVCKDLQDPFVKLNKSTIGLFQPFKPQLGHKDVPKDVRAISHEGKFYIEEKLDGDRMQMHYDATTQRFKWFTRKSNDYTQYYGEKPLPGKLSGHIVDSLKGVSLVLDGEMMTYDPKLDVFLPFGGLRTAALDTSLDPHKAHPCFVVFDIVYCNNTPLLDYPLKDRIKLLNNVVTENRGWIHLLPRETKTTHQDIINALDRAMSLRQEGLVIKNPGSIYEPGTRNTTWIKLKPEYIDSLNDTCDLLVIGAKYGTGKHRGGRLSQFLCAIRDDRSTTKEPKFMTFCMLGTGYTVDELDKFKEKFKELEPYDAQRQPEWLIHPEKSDENPEMIVDYRRSVVVEVKASEIIWGNTYGSGSTLRFPRFMSFREDKTWEDIMTWSDMNKAKREGTLGGQKRSVTDKDFTGQPKKRKTSAAARKTKLGFSHQGVDTRNIKTKTSLFSDLSFYVVSGDESTNKAQLETMIKENDGKFLQTTHGVKYIVAGSKNPRVDGIISKDEQDIVFPKWIVDCVEEQDLVPLGPKYMLHITEATKDTFRQEMDPWGDLYIKEATEQSLRDVMSRMTIGFNENTQRPLADEIRERYFHHQGIPGMMFLGVKAYLDDDNGTMDSSCLDMHWVRAQKSHERMTLASKQIRFRGGQIVNCIEPGITHVIMDPDNLDRLQALTDATKGTLLPRFVTTDWIDACVNNKTLIDERRYEPKIPHSASTTLSTKHN
ncbi:hypothetical protein BDA99DRAFT_525900 [Phascolomyces articulosus]|uniref:DNA ligase n=1 Tax=Phascolomyces articulosus TaxID=60185 RepID=A0AAD5P9Y9_9FUNG|nr:hypothetical protein BDA99DRAFT_525900 [Phascolomyces articulosus]